MPVEVQEHSDIHSRPLRISVVRVGSLVLQVSPISPLHEAAFRRDLRVLAKAAVGDYFKPIEPLLRRLGVRILSRPQAVSWIESAIQTAVRMEALGVLPPDEAGEHVRRSPKGVALELWHRTRATNRSLQLRELEVLVTIDNADDVARQIQDALSDGIETAEDAPLPAGPRMAC